MAQTDPLRSIRGLRALVTGAASGMGAATVELFAREGALVAATDINLEGCERLVADLKADAITSAQAFALDVRDPDTIDRVVADIGNRFGGLDILVNNAGLARFGPVDGETYESDWSLSMDVMLNAHQRMIRAALPFLRKSASPRIVNIASTEGLCATPMNSAYVAAKHGVIGLTRGMAVDLGKEGITVNCICPGPINTNITASIPDEDKQVFARRRTALRRYGEPHEVAHITLSCVMPAASYMTGAVIPVDGGLTIRNA